jgi:hypothetical protein
MCVTARFYEIASTFEVIETTSFKTNLKAG